MGNTEIRMVENQKDPRGNTYTGQVKGTKRHGQGTFTWTDGGVYTGNWEDDQCSGQGTMRFPNGSVYEGKWVRNNPYGPGKLTTINGEVLSGFWNFLGRSTQTATPVGKYNFSGELIDVKTGTTRALNGQLALYLLSGLVSLPGMQDPYQALLPFAIAEATVTGSVEGAKSNAPVAQVVQNELSSSSSISYGKPELAFHPTHKDDHPSFNLADPRMWLGSIGITNGAPDTNFARQMQIKEEQARMYANIGHNGDVVPPNNVVVAVPVTDPNVKI